MFKCPRGDSLVNPSYLVVCNFPLYSSIRRNIEVSVSNMFRIAREAISGIPIDVLVCLYVSSLNCMRITELLAITASDYLGDSRFLVRGLKRSSNYTISLQCIENRELAPTPFLLTLPVVPVEYMRVYRWCCRTGIGRIKPGGKTIRRTHLHRYYTAEKIREKSEGIAVSDILHHRTLSSATYYSL